MKRKAADKLFDLVYTDSMTGAFNRNAYEEEIKRLKNRHIQLDNVTVVAVKLHNLEKIKNTMGNRTGDEAIKLVSSCILKTVGEKADVYRIDDDEFLCIAENDILSYISELRDLLGFESKSKKYVLNALIGYMRFDSRKHRSIDDLIKDCDKELLKTSYKR